MVIINADCVSGLLTVKDNDTMGGGGGGGVIMIMMIYRRA